MSIRPRQTLEPPPLLINIHLGDQGVVGALINAGADVNKATTNDGTPHLYFAARHGHQGVLGALIN